MYLINQLQYFRHVVLIRILCEMAQELSVDKKSIRLHGHFSVYYSVNKVWYFSIVRILPSIILGLARNVIFEILVSNGGEDDDVVLSCDVV
jgi:hypothetical protein